MDNFFNSRDERTRTSFGISASRFRMVSLNRVVKKNGQHSLLDGLDQLVLVCPTYSLPVKASSNIVGCVKVVSRSGTAFF